jgi:L,D-transpeptidase catalytic domain
MRMRHASRFVLVVGCVGGLLLLVGCGTTRVAGGKPYHVTAYRPHDPSAVRVKVSLSNQNIYVMEGDRCLMAVACSVGLANKPTPHGNFTIYSKQERKRSGEYGFSVQGNQVVATTAGHAGGHYIGYPMGYWCEFAPGYGFHQGFVHPNPRTHGCIRLHGEAAPKFFALVRTGTPVNIATTQPEDAMIGPKVERVDDSRTPDPDPHIMVTDAAFEQPSGPLLE